MAYRVTVRELSDPQGGFTWDAEHRIYIDQDGNAVNQEQLRGAVDDYLAEQTQAADRLSNRLSSGGLELPSWQSRFRNLVMTTVGAAFIVGRGGRKAMDAVARSKLGDTVAGQFQWLDGFARDLSQGQLSPQGLLARAQQYIASGRTAFERGRAATFDDLDLPAEPGFGCACGARCRCHWDINEFPDRWECFWICELDASTCSDCDQRASDYSPWVQLKTVVDTMEEVE